MLKPNEKVGVYTLLSKIGRGGFGEVWKAEKRNALAVSEFALKFMRSEEDTPLNLEFIKKEVSIGQKVSGLPHIIHLIEADEYEDYIYLVSEFADGGSLQKWLRANGGKAPTFEDAVEIADQILKGLEGLHRQGFIHRDLKPDNVLIKKGTYCLADFGIARQIQTNSATMNTAGTYIYMPPEAFSKKPLVSPHTDIWATGVILQQLLTGALPFLREDTGALLWAIINEDPEPVSETVPAEIRTVINRALQKQREDRFQTAREMRLALEKAWEKHSGDAEKNDVAASEPPLDTTQFADAEHVKTTVKMVSEQSFPRKPKTAPEIKSKTEPEIETVFASEGEPKIAPPVTAQSSRRGIVVAGALTIAAAGAIGVYSLILPKPDPPINVNNAAIQTEPTVVPDKQPSPVPSAVTATPQPSPIVSPANSAPSPIARQTPKLQPLRKAPSKRAPKPEKRPCIFTGEC